MLASLSINDCVEMFVHVCNVIVSNEPYLTAIDEKIGDGDHGIGMKRGFSHLKVELKKEHTFNSIHDLMKFCGIELLKVMGGASGVLFGTFFLGGIKGTPDVKHADTKYLALFFLASLKAIEKRGQANPGDKTMVDALNSAVESLTISAKHGHPVDLALQNAQNCAKAGAESTKEMTSKFGRARQYGKESIGFQDAGATSIYLIFKAMSDWVNINN